MKLEWPDTLWIPRAPGYGGVPFFTKEEAISYCKFLRENGCLDIEVCAYKKSGSPIKVNAQPVKEASKPAPIAGATPKRK